jgi:ATP-dependent RNA helicase DHX57
MDGAVTHIVVDEVHERSVDADFLLAVLRRIIAKRRDIKLVLMSATVDAGKFQDYFASKGRPCPVIEVPGFVHPVREVYLDEILAITDYTPPKRMFGAAAARDAASAGAAAGPGSGATVDSSAWHSSRGDPAAIAHLVCAIASGAGAPAPPPDARRKPAALPSDKGTILVFLPGVPEIRNLGHYIRDVAGSWGVASTLHVVELHGGLAGKDQAAVFENPPRGSTKVVLATNVAETSVTIDGVTDVIDGGRVKMTQYDAANRMSKLEEMWTAQDSADQRRGRAGRTRPGVCYRVYPESMKSLLSPHSEPEIRRVALEGLCLQIRLLGLGSIRKFLAACLDPPAEDHIRSALSQLQAMGAIQPGAKDDEFELLPLGKHIARLPMDVRLAKCLIFGAILRCVDPVLTVTATLAGRTPLHAPPDMRSEAAAAHSRFARGQSDHMRMVAVYQAFSEQSGYGAKKRFCGANFLSFTRMLEIDDLRRDYAATLQSLGFLRGGGGAGGGGRGGSSKFGRHGELAPDVNVCSSKSSIVRSALVAGLYPNIVKVVYPKTTYMDTAGGKVAVASESRSLRFYTLADGTSPEVKREVAAAVAARAAGGASSGAAARPRGSVTVFDGLAQHRVFMHPQSVCFTEGAFSCPWLIFSDKAETSKPFIRDATVAPAYALLLFGGKLETRHEDGLVTVGGNWIRFTAVAAIGVIVSRLRTELDRLLVHKIDNPNARIHDSPAVEVILELLEGGGARVGGT